MDQKQKAHLQKMIEEYGVEDTTEEIRSTQHSKILLQELYAFERFKKENKRLSNEMYNARARSMCPCMSTKYEDIFNKLVGNKLDVNILHTFILTLGKIEEGTLNQHEASFQIGGLLKKMYIDEKLKEEKKQMKKEHKITKSNESMSWNDFKINQSLHEMD